MRLFVLRAGAIGDFILTLPALYALRQKFPTHHFILAARADVLPLVQGTLADDVIAFDDERLTLLFSPDAQPTIQLSNLLSNTDLAVLWLPDPTARIVAGNLRRLDVARLIAANPLPTARHAADHLLDTLAPLGIISREARPQLALAPAARALADEFWSAHAITPQARVVALHVGSGGAHKRWPLENFLTLTHRLALLDGVRVLLVHGRAERVIASSHRTLLAMTIELDSPPLPLLASILARCALYIGNDSGITHLAAALGTPTIALFGPTDPNLWGPRGAHVTILRSSTPHIADLALDDVWRAVERASASAQT